MQGHGLGFVAVRQGVGETQGQFRVRAAPDRHEDSPDLGRAALLDDGDVAGRVADDLVDRRREDGGLGSGPGVRRSAGPAEHDQVRVQLRRRFDDAFRGSPPDPNDGVDRHALRRVVEDLLQQPSGLAGPCRAVAQRRSLGNLDDAEDIQHARPAVHQRRADADQFLGGERVGDGNEILDGSGVRVIGPPRRPFGPVGPRPGGRRGSRPAAPPRAACSTRYGLRSSNSRACRSTVLGLLFGEVPVLDHQATDAAEVDRDERGHETLEFEVAEADRDEQVVEDASPQVVGEVEGGHGVG